MIADMKARYCKRLLYCILDSINENENCVQKVDIVTAMK